jgi:hypothetical protein
MGLTDVLMCITAHLNKKETCVENMIKDLAQIHNTILCFVCITELAHTELAISYQIKVRLSSIILQNLIEITPTESHVNVVMDKIRYVQSLLSKCCNIDELEHTYRTFYLPDDMTTMDEKVSHQAKNILIRIINHKNLDESMGVYHECIQHEQKVSRPFNVYIGPLQGMLFQILLFIEECCLRLCQCVIQNRKQAVQQMESRFVQLYNLLRCMNFGDEYFNNTIIVLVRELREIKLRADSLKDYMQHIH